MLSSDVPAVALIVPSVLLRRPSHVSTWSSQQHIPKRLNSVLVFVSVIRVSIPCPAVAFQQGLPKVGCRHLARLPAAYF